MAEMTILEVRAMPPSYRRWQQLTVTRIVLAIPSMQRCAASDAISASTPTLGEAAARKEKGSGDWVGSE